MGKKSGLILKGISGFYYVQTDDGITECRARGIFRKQHIKPLAGDHVKIETEGESGTVTEIEDRKNFLVRPPVANIDQLVIVSSMAEPNPNTLLIDKMIAVAELKKIEPVVVFTKCDMLPADRYVDGYTQAGFCALAVSNTEGCGVEDVRNMLKGKISTFAGNSGVGKSSLLNRISPGLGAKTAQISKKLGRGRHTTREVELYALDCGGYVADTPGFSTLDLERFETVLKEDLPYAFRDFRPFLSRCRFNGCTHIRERDCAVIRAVEEGRIQPSRYKSYVAMYNDVKDIKEWDLLK